MKTGTRALGVACSDDERTSTLAGAVVRADRVVDGFVFGACGVGELDATDALLDCFRRLDRPDVRYLLLSGVAPAWFNLFDLDRLYGTTDRPVLSVSFEDSAGLTDALHEAFDGEALDRRLAIYDRLPDRQPVTVGDGRDDEAETVFVRCVGIDDDEARAVVRGFTPEGGRPEPVRVARLAARAGREWREE